jgi:predicted permease
LLAKERAFTAAAIVVLTLGIGVNATGFTLVHGVFLRERSLRDANQVYVLSWDGPGRRAALSHPDFEDWRAQSRAFAHLAALTTATMTVSDDRALPEQAFGARITADAFSVFGQTPLLGRTFTTDDERKDATPVAIVAHHMWRNRFQEDPAILGATLRVNGNPATIVGVMPQGIRFPGNAEVWVPWIPGPEQEQRSNRALLVFGRLKPDSSRREAEAEAATIAAQLIATYPEDTKGFSRVIVQSVPDRFVGRSAGTMFLAMMAAVCFVLLIACANVANLLLSRSAYRAREVAMRMALGATRIAIVRQFLVETLVLAVAGAALGLGLAYGGVRLFDTAVLDRTRPYWIVFTVDYAVFGYVAGVCVLTAVAAGLAPALHASRANSGSVLTEGARGNIGSVRTRWFSSALTIAQIALTIVLLAGAGLMVRSFHNLRSADIGFAPERLLTMRLQLPRPKYAAGEARLAFYDQLESRIATIPGVDAVAITTAVPPANNEERWLQIEGGGAVEQPPRVSVVRIGPRFFETLGRGVLRGRGFQPSGGERNVDEVLINERLARQWFGGEDPIGRQLRFVGREGGAWKPAERWFTIVGISPPIRHSSPADAETDPVVYVPYVAEPPGGAWVLVRTPLPPGSVSGDIRKAVQAIDADQPIFDIQSLGDLMRERRWPYTAFGGAFAIFAAIALLLASVGLYALIAFAVTQRTHEIGVRRAVGARGSDIAWLFLKRGLTQLAIGLALGLAGASALSGVLRSMLVGVTPGDPFTFTVVVAILSAVAIAACLLPVRRAIRIDPLVALRLN